MGSRKTAAPFDPCCLRLSAPLVEKTFKNWSKSSTLVVASIMLVLLVASCVAFARLGFRLCDRRSADGAHPARLEARNGGFLRIDHAEILDDLELPVAGLGDVHVHANMMLAG